MQCPKWTSGYFFSRFSRYFTNIKAKPLFIIYLSRFRAIFSIFCQKPHFDYRSLHFDYDFCLIENQPTHNRPYKYSWYFFIIYQHFCATPLYIGCIHSGVYKLGGRSIFATSFRLFYQTGFSHEFILFPFCSQNLLFFASRFFLNYYPLKLVTFFDIKNSFLLFLIWNTHACCNIFAWWANIFSKKNVVFFYDRKLCREAQENAHSNYHHHNQNHKVMNWHGKKMLSTYKLQITS